MVKACCMDRGRCQWFRLLGRKDKQAEKNGDDMLTFDGEAYHGP